MGCKCKRKKKVIDETMSNSIPQEKNNITIKKQDLETQIKNILSKFPKKAVLN